MSSDVTCFGNIIGLTRTPCNDYTDIPANYTTSASGLYLDEVIPLSTIESLLNCKVGENVFVFMDRARENAIIDFRTDATAFLLDRTKQRRPAFSGLIGKVKRSKTLSLTTGKYYGISLRCDDIVAGQMIVSTIRGIFDTTGTVTIYVYNNLNELLDTVTLNVVADTLSTATVNIRPELHSQYVENLEFYFVYEYDGVITPYNNELYDSKSYYRTPRSSSSNRQFGYSDYLIASGVQLTDISDFSDLSCSHTATCYGLILGVSLYCNAEEIWCYDGMDYLGNTIDMAIAKAVRLKAVSNLIRDIALSENLNFETVINGETLGDFDERYNAEYTDMLNFIVKNMDVSKTDCFECEDKLLMGVNTIFS